MMNKTKKKKNKNRTDSERLTNLESIKSLRDLEDQVAEEDKKGTGFANSFVKELKAKFSQR